jgi:exonuclease SbcD
VASLLLGRLILKVAQFSDLHYSPGNLVEADRCFSFAVGNAIDRGAQIGVVTGDSTDHRLEAHSPALNALANQVHRLISNRCPMAWWLSPDQTAPARRH